MLCLREAEPKDISGLLSLSQLGVTSFPRTEQRLSYKIEKSINSFRSAPTHPGDEYYFFVLEDEGKVVGTSSIRASSLSIPTFRRVEATPALLQLVTENPEASELCGLVLHEQARKRGLGHLTSQGRLLFIADHLTRFHDLLLADIRGFLTPEGECPFWEHLCHPFCNLSYREAEALYRDNPQGLTPLLPIEAIALSLISTEVQEYIGKTHPHSKGALHLLFKEGFHLGPEIHPLDGGPRVWANLLEIHSIRDGEIGTLSSRHLGEGVLSLISRTEPPFRATEALIQELPEGHIALAQLTQEILQVAPGDHLRYLKVKK